MRKLSIYKQLILWVFGKSVHNHTTDECCPDFSCCEPSLKEPFHERLSYALKYPFRSIKYNYVVARNDRIYAKCKK